MCLPLTMPDEREARRYLRQRSYTRLFDAWMRDNSGQRTILDYTSTHLVIS